MPIRSIYSLASVAALVLLLTGCASNYAARLADSGSYTAQPTRSEALNVAVAAGLTRCDDNQCKPINDAPRSKLPAAYRGASNASIAGEVVDALTLAQGVGQVAGVVNVASGLGSVAGGLMTLGNFLAAPVPRDNPATLGFVLAWMPESMAQSPEAARKVMYEKVLSAVQSEGLSGYHTKTFPNENYWQAGVNFIGPDCNKNEHCGVHLRVGIPYITQVAPSGIEATGPVYAWPVWSKGATGNDELRSIRLGLSYKEKALYENYHWPTSVDGLEYLARVSAHLPDWAYIYSPPTQKHPYPAMFNDGEMLLFIEPLTNQTNTKQTA